MVDGYIFCQVPSINVSCPLRNNLCKFSSFRMFNLTSSSSPPNESIRCPQPSRA